VADDSAAFERAERATGVLIFALVALDKEQ
jgi:hypothetical protein